MTNYEGNIWKIKDKDEDIYAYIIEKDESTGMFTAYKCTGETSASNNFPQLIAELGRKDNKDYSKKWYGSD
jgi:hypothetical protein